MDEGEEHEEIFADIQTATLSFLKIIKLSTILQCSLKMLQLISVLSRSVVTIRFFQNLIIEYSSFKSMVRKVAKIGTRFSVHSKCYAFSSVDLVLVILRAILNYLKYCALKAKAIANIFFSVKPPAGCLSFKVAEMIFPCYGIVSPDDIIPMQMNRNFKLIVQLLQFVPKTIASPVTETPSSFMAKTFSFTIWMDLSFSSIWTFFTVCQKFKFQVSSINLVHTAECFGMTNYFG